MRLAVYFYDLNYIITISQYIVRNTAAAAECRYLGNLLYSQRTNKQHYSRQFALRNAFFSISSLTLSSKFTAIEEVAKNKQRESNRTTTHSLLHAPDLEQKTKGPRVNVWTSAVCHQFRSIYFACGPLDQRLSHSDQELAWNFGEWILCVFWLSVHIHTAIYTRSRITRCFLWPNYFGCSTTKLNWASKNSGWEHTMRWGNASKDSRWQNFYGAMLAPRSFKKDDAPVGKFFMQLCVRSLATLGIVAKIPGIFKMPVGLFHC